MKPKAETFVKGLFKEPYNYADWLKDQSVFIERLKKAGMDKHAKTMQDFQDINVCSPIMVKIMKERINKGEEEIPVKKTKKANTSTKVRR